MPLKTLVLRSKTIDPFFGAIRSWVACALRSQDGHLPRQAPNLAPCPKTNITRFLAHYFGASALVLSLIFLSACTAELGISDDESPFNAGSGNGSGSGNDNGNSGTGSVAGLSNLACDTFIWCSNWESNNETPQLPSSGETTIQDGLYRLEEGTANSIAIAFSGDRFSRILPNNLNLHGTFRISGDSLFFTNESRCDEEGDFDLPSPFESSAQKFRVNGNQLYFFDDVCEFDECGPLWRFVKVEELCSENQDFSCTNGNCVCDFEVNSGFQNVPSCSE